MSGPMSDQAEGIALGPFDVATDPAAVAAFAAATGHVGSEIPATFPILWLSSPDLKQALRAFVGPDSLPVHESQSFDYSAPLRVGTRYSLAGVARRQANPDRLVVEAEARDPHGRAALALRSVLRVIPLAGRQIP
jgi:hypothetical protein